MSTFNPDSLALNPPGPDSCYTTDECDQVLLVLRRRTTLVSSLPRPHEEKVATQLRWLSHLQDRWLDHRAEAARDMVAMEVKKIAVETGLWTSEDAGLAA